MDCECGSTHPFERLHFSPSAAIGRSALVLVDVASGALLEPMMPELLSELGAFIVVGRRVG